MNYQVTPCALSINYFLVCKGACTCVCVCMRAHACACICESKNEEQSKRFLSLRPDELDLFSHPHPRHSEHYVYKFNFMGYLKWLIKIW